MLFPTKLTMPNSMVLISRKSVNHILRYALWKCQKYSENSAFSLCPHDMLRNKTCVQGKNAKLRSIIVNMFQNIGTSEALKSLGQGFGAMFQQTPSPTLKYVSFNKNICRSEALKSLGQGFGAKFQQIPA